MLTKNSVFTIYGLPGSGKSSVLTALQSVLDFDVIPQFHEDPAYQSVFGDYMLTIPYDGGFSYGLLLQAAAFHKVLNLLPLLKPVFLDFLTDPEIGRILFGRSSLTGLTNTIKIYIRSDIDAAFRRFNSRPLKFPQFKAPIAYSDFLNMVKDFDSYAQLHHHEVIEHPATASLDQLILKVKQLLIAKFDFKSRI